MSGEKQANVPHPGAHQPASFISHSYSYRDTHQCIFKLFLKEKHVCQQWDYCVLWGEFPHNVRITLADRRACLSGRGSNKLLNIGLIISFRTVKDQMFNNLSSGFPFSLLIFFPGGFIPMKITAASYESDSIIFVLSFKSKI